MNRLVVIGRIGTDGAAKSRLEIAVDKRSEYNKSPLNGCVMTGKNGDPVTLRHNNEECEASLHNYAHSFYISSARLRLGDKKYTGLFRAFMTKAGLTKEGTKVELIFITYPAPYKIVLK